MTFAATGTAPNITITQTGTDASLAGLAGVSGVTVTGTNIKTYLLSGAKLVINGTVTFDPRFERLEGLDNCPAPEVRVTGAGASLTVGIAGRSRPAPACALLVRRQPANAWTPNDSALIVDAGATLTWRYGDLVGPASLYVTPTASASTFDGRLLSMPPLGGGYTGTFVRGPLTWGSHSELHNGGIDFGGTTPNFSNLTLIDAGTGLHAAGGTLAAPWVINAATLIGASLVFPYTARVHRVHNCKGGGALGKAGGAVQVGWRTLIMTSADLTAQIKYAGAAVQDAACFVRDTNNGQRADFLTVGGIAFSGSADRTYYAATNAAGQATLTPDLQYWSLSDTNTAQTDWRTLAPNSNTMRLHVWSYGHQYATADVDLGGGGVTVQPVYLSGDTSVTLTRAAAAALTQVATLDNLYDALKFWRCTAGNLEYPTVGTQPAVTSGASLDIGSRSLVLDPAASAVVSIAGGVITVKGAVLAAGVKHTAIKSTGTVTAVGGGVVSAPVVDANGDSYLKFEGIDSWVVYSDSGRTAQIGAGTGSQLFRFVYAASTTYYLKCTSGSTEFAMVSTPTSSGATVVSLDTQALLTTLQAQVGAVKADTGLIKVAVL